MSKSPATGRSGERLFQVKEQLIQRPWGRTLPGVWEEQQGGPCVWRTVSERQEEGKEDTEGTWQVMQSLVGCGKKFKLTQELNQGLLHCSWILYQLSYQFS